MSIQSPGFTDKTHLYLANTFCTPSLHHMLETQCWKTPPTTPTPDCSLPWTHKQTGQRIHIRPLPLLAMPSPHGAWRWSSPHLLANLCASITHIWETSPDWEGIRACMLEIQESLKRPKHVKITQSRGCDKEELSNAIFKERENGRVALERFLRGKVYEQGFGKQAWKLLFPASVFFPLLSAELLEQN